MVNKRGFTLIELLVTIAIILVLVGLVLPAMSRTRRTAMRVTCQTNLKEFVRGWQMYADENLGVAVAHRMYNKEPKGFANPKNWYDVGNGVKYRPRWPAQIGAFIGIYAFSDPKTDEDRQDYTNDIYKCPEEPTWVDERNFAYGYNYQFLGNGRQSNGRFHNFPVFLGQLKATSGTVVFADSMGTAAAFPMGTRGPYENNGTGEFSSGNHGYSIDPPRLTEESDRGGGVGEGGDPESRRSAVHPRHKDVANTAFGDGHVEAKTPHELGYRIIEDGGCYAFASADEDCSPGGGGGDPTGYSPASSYSEPLYFGMPGEDPFDPNRATNRFFSGSGQDDDPPPIP